MKPTSRAVKESRARTGTKPTSFAFSAEERDEVDRFAIDRGLNRKAAILLALRAYGANDPTPEQALRIIERALKGRVK